MYVRLDSTTACRSIAVTMAVAVLACSSLVNARQRSWSPPEADATVDSSYNAGVSPLTPRANSAVDTFRAPAAPVRLPPTQAPLGGTLQVAQRRETGTEAALEPEATPKYWSSYGTFSEAFSTASSAETTGAEGLLAEEAEGVPLIDKFDDGFALVSRGDDFELRLRALLQTDFKYFLPRDQEPRGPVFTFPAFVPTSKDT